ncbi:unnamed protein product [Peronospora destructor]|uniref:Uncharacterized protein n=1 Tax=Peronospora destructor TaxID=86335 RepID=A0AAV0V7M1_9STRA|nr:unnamed protein product [Peronospora destructor]
MSTRSRRRSLSESSFSALKAEENPSFTLLPNELVDDHHPLLLSGRHGEDSFAAMEQRSKSESIICTAQGIVFQDTKSQEYWSKLNNLVALAADSSSSQSNVVLARKALRYRKVLERHRFV